MNRRKLSYLSSVLSGGYFLNFSSAAGVSVSFSLWSSSPSSSSFFFVSSFLVAAIVVAFDVAVLSSALASFATKGGGKDSFDLFICIPPSSTLAAELAEAKLEDVLILNGILEYRAVLHTNCSQIQPQSVTDYSQILYMIMSSNKTEIENSLHQISQFYHMIKNAFYNSSPPVASSSAPAVGKLLWMPLFLVVWPDMEDYCGNDITTEKLIRVSFHQPRYRPLAHPPSSATAATTANNNKNNGRARVNDKRVFPLSPPSFSVNSDVYFYFGKECDGKRDNVWEVYTLHPATAGGEETVVQKLTPDSIPYESMFEGILGRVRRRMNLRETIIRSVSSKDPSSFLEDPSPEVLDPLHIINGTPHVVFQELRQGLNFTANIIIGDWIRKHPNGTLKGFTASLFRQGMADVTISLTSLVPYRKKELSFLQPTYSDSVNGFFVQPEASSFRDIVIAPFSFGLWLSLLITYLIIVSSILCFGKVSGKVHAAAVAEKGSTGELIFLPCYTPNEKVSPKRADNDFLLQDELLLWAVGAMTQQGWHICPDSNSTRMAFLLGYFLGIVCYGAFSAAVVSILAVELIPIKTQADLLNSSLTFYADDASSTLAYNVNYLRNNTQVRFGPQVNIKQGVEKLKNGKKQPSCFLAFPQYFYLSAATINISQTWICDTLSVIPVTTSATPSSMVVSRNSEYAELFNFMIIKMMGRGLNYRFVQQYKEVTTLKCSKLSGQVFQPLVYSDLLTAFIIVFLGAVIAVSMFVVEKMFIFIVSRRASSKKISAITTGTSPVAVATFSGGMQNDPVFTYGNWLF